MRIPKFWVKEVLVEKDAKGRKVEAIATGWSFESFEDAKSNALNRAKKVMERLISREFFNGDSYYFDRPIREEIVDEIIIDGEQVAVITRNNYGAIVLNAANAMFVDVDFPISKTGGGLFSLFRKRKSELDPAEQTIAKVESWAKLNPNKSFRLYKTAAGLRLLFSDKKYQPKSSEVSQIMQSLAADPLYQKLCEAQECFRARLTPKPWRCGFRRPPRQFPYIDQKAQDKNRAWEAKYAKKSQNYATADLIAEFGQAATEPTIIAVIAYHDEIAKVNQNQKLA